MTSTEPPRPSAPRQGDAASRLDVLLQVIREVEALCSLQHLVPRDLLWERPPGLPSGAELLWLVHLVDRHVFLPLTADEARPAPQDVPPPDYAGLLTTYPCTAASLEDLASTLRQSREILIDRLSAGTTAVEDETRDSELVETITAHDRRILAALTERLYESGLGA